MQVSDKELRLHQSVANQLIQDIGSGTYPVGSRLPPESELATQLGVSRFTLRESLRYLQSLGLVTRRQGHGTVVRAKEANRQLKLTVGSVSDIESHGQVTHLVGIDKRIVEADVALSRDLPCDPGERFLHISYKRVPAGADDTVPPALNDTYVVEPLAAVGEAVGDRLVGPLYLEIERMFGERIEVIEQDVGALKFDLDTCRALGVPRGSVGLRIKRSYYNRSARRLMVTYHRYAGDRFSLNMRIQHG
ncbi:GntR family transcriptional regulator [Acuticoccus sp. M5D2P5]|uniref:GntR family transcriptional regulator n=1 Tax=Acuticoccus kalidii TaxID=2910977 RepID=UPI001F19F3DC|nr:GntR family transcriptional regulator [Acuticoccus kalidii]MCF3932744.1 GntR family transcriptional regulator [Acuticoccus kalidii]